MSYHSCDFCDNESRFVCVKCKRDICKDHAVYKRRETGGEWVCTECHKTSTGINIVLAIVFIIIFIVFVVIAINIMNDFPNDVFPFP